MAEIRRVIWSHESSKRILSIKDYLLKEWGERELNAFLVRLKKFESLVLNYPNLYPTSKVKAGLRKAVITKYQSVIYELDRSTVKVITIIDHRQSKSSEF
jgi:plasmid stabilization system protein ParE